MANKEITILPAEKRMAYDIAKAHIRSSQAAYKGIIPDSFLESMSIKSRAQSYKFDDELGKDDFFFAVNIGGAISGLLYLCKYRGEAPKDTGEIGGIYLAPEYWHEGYGKKMMDFSLDFLKNKGYGTIKIWVLEQNKTAIDFYKKFGFSFDGKIKFSELGKSLKTIRYSATFK
jgi:ribosomal protein S18 acetylase RimI-like enzyme